MAEPKGSKVRRRSMRGKSFSERLNANDKYKGVAGFTGTLDADPDIPILTQPRRSTPSYSEPRKPPGRRSC